MSALSSAIEHPRAGGDRVRAGREVGVGEDLGCGGRIERQPAQRLLDVRQGADARRRQPPRHGDAIRRQVRRAGGNRDGERRRPGLPGSPRARRRRAAGRARATRARPMPVPSCVRACACFTRWKRWNIRGRSAAGMPTPVSAICSSACVAAPAQRDANLALERELERVGQQVEDDLLPHVAIDVDRLRQRRAGHDEPQPGFLDRRAEHAGELGGDAGEVHGLEAGVDAPGLDAGEVEERVHQLQEPQAVAMRDLEPGRRVGRQRLDLLAQHVLERAQHQRQRRAELVRDVREEGGLRAIQFREALGPPPLLLERLGVGEPGGNLRRRRARRTSGSRRRARASGSPPPTRMARGRSWPGSSTGSTSALAGDIFQALAGNGSKRVRRSSAAHSVPRRRRSPSATGRQACRASTRSGAAASPAGRRSRPCGAPPCPGRPRW